MQLVHGGPRMRVDRFYLDLDMDQEIKRFKKKMKIPKNTKKEKINAIFRRYLIDKRVRTNTGSKSTKWKNHKVSMHDFYVLRKGGKAAERLSIRLGIR